MPGDPALGRSLGLGLIGIGRRWGHTPGEPPPEADVMALLERALSLGIRYFDTAPSYGSSEERLGRFLASLDPGMRAGLTVATKFGEHWDPHGGDPFVDHSLEALQRSLDRSLRRLGRIDVLQLHKTTPEALASGDVAAAFDYAARCGVACVGPSVSDLESARIALGGRRYGVIQLPLNRANPRFAEVVEAAGARGMSVAVNRPFAMGAMLSEPVESFRFILRRLARGVVLTGTRSPAHLADNLRAFNEACAGTP